MDRSRRTGMAAQEFTRRAFLQVSSGTLGALALGGWGRSAQAAAAPAPNLAGKTIGYSNTYVLTEWNSQQRRAVEEAAARHGVKCITYNADDNPNKEVSNLEDLVTRKVDIIIINTYYAEAIRPAIKMINEAKIPIVVLSSSLATGSDFTSHLSVDTLGSARDAGRLFVQKLGGKGKVVQIEGKPGSVVNQMRGRGFREVIDKEKGIEVVADVVCNYERVQALRAMEDILRAHPKIDAVYCHSNDMTLGAIQAAKEAGRNKDMWFVGYDGLTLEELQAIYNGDIFATYFYLPFGAEGVEVAIRILRGQKVPKEVVFPSPLMTKENITEWYDPATKSRKPAMPRPIPEA